MEPGTSETRLGSAPLHPISVTRLTPGTVLADRYRIVALLGRGGMGEVYRADDLRLGQPVALKFLPRDLEDNAFAKERLLAEVRSARTVSHPNVCRVYDVGEVHGHVFLTMEYIDGEDLASLLRRIGRLPPGKALEVARQLSAGLAAAHDRGVLHRDLKPANVMIDGRGQARITDFGLAVEVEEPGAGALQQGGPPVVQVAGTVAYLAPERFEGRPATVQSDLYALGMVLYEVYTGKQAVSASTIEGWRRAHRDSTPSHPSAIVSEIEPAVERAILRCLEKDPAKRPGSAAQLAASLPGGDPLAAALAAGETPSPELVAASGEEGTLPRARAWLLFGTCLVLLVLAVVFGSEWQLSNVMQLNDPALQRARARELLNAMGYVQAPRDYVGAYFVDDGYLARMLRSSAPRDWFAEPAHPRSQAIYFFYRESARPLFSWRPFGEVLYYEPPPLERSDLYLELDGAGRLVRLSAGGLAFRPSPPGRTQTMDWRPAFAGAGLNMSAFSDARVEWPSVFTSDESRAWLGTVDGTAVRVEASAYGGRPVKLVVTSADSRPEAAPGSRQASVLNVLLTLTLFASVAVLAVFARHNVRTGRGDRKGAHKVTLAVLAAELVYVAFTRHWTFEPLNLATVLIYVLGAPLFAAGAAWLYYAGLEPFVRRRWPHLLVGWTRLLDGRWRDPLVGQSLLVGAAAALLVVGVLPGLMALATRWYSVPLAVPRFQKGSLTQGAAWFLCYAASGWVAPVHALLLVAVLLIARLVLRYDRPSWLVLLLVTFALHLWELHIQEPWSDAAPLGLFLQTGVFAATLVLLLARGGLLTATVFYAVTIALWETPITYDLTRWYAWRTGVVVMLVGALVFWGFRNVLGRQSAFPAGALDE